MDLAGKTALITGASRGIGAATARAFSAQGANVILLARSQKAIDELAAEIGNSALAVACDVSNYDQVAMAAAQAARTFGAVDILVNNAGVIEPVSHLATSNPENWGRAFDINLKGVYNGMRAVLPGMLNAGSGTVLTLSSGAAHGPVEGWSHYCASKAAAAMLTRCIDAENRANGIRAMGLSPGTVATQMQREIKASGVNPVSKLDWSDHIPPDWPARALVWMCTPESDEFLGRELSLRDEGLRKRLGLVA